MDHSVTRQIGLLFIGRAVAFLFVFALPLVLVRIFSPEDFALYKQLFLIHGTLVAILAFGFSASLYYFVPRHASREQHAYVSQTLLILASLGLAGAGLLVAFKAQVAALLNNPAVEQYLPYLAAFTVLTLVASVLETLMVILKQAKLAAVTNVASEFLRAAAIIGIVVLTRSMLVLVLAWLAWAGVRFIALLVYLRKLGVPGWPSLDRERLAEQLRYSVPFGFALIAWTSANNLHYYVVSYLYSPALFAIYVVGCVQVPVTAIVFESVADVTLVRLTELRKDGLLGEAVRLIGEWVTKLGLFFFPLYAWLIVNARDFIVLLFTDRFEASVDIFRIFLATVPLLVLELDYVARAFAETGFILRINLVRLILSAVLLATLVNPLGLAGAALATVLAIAMTKALMLVKLKTLLGVPVRRFLPWGRLGTILADSLLAGALAWAVPAAWLSTPGGRLALSALLFTVCYGVLIWNQRLLTAEEKRWVRELVRRLTETVIGGLSVKARASVRGEWRGPGRSRSDGRDR